MLVQLLKGQIADDWEFMGGYIERSLLTATTSDNLRMSEVLSALLNGRLQCWYFYENVDEDERNDVVAIVITMVTKDVGAGSNQLLVYSLCGIKKLNMQSFEQLLIDLKTVAKAAGSNRITMQTNLRNATSLATRLGGNTDTTLIYFVC